jgi:hypothetical protein
MILLLEHRLSWKVYGGVNCTVKKFLALSTKRNRLFFVFFYATSWKPSLCLHVQQCAVKDRYDVVRGGVETQTHHHASPRAVTQSPPMRAAMVVVETVALER